MGSTKLCTNLRVDSGEPPCLAPWEAEPYRLWRIMDVFKMSGCCRIACTAVSLHETLQQYPAGSIMGPEYLPLVRNLVSTAHQFLGPAGLRMAVASLKSIEIELTDPSTMYAHNISHKLEVLSDRIVDELQFVRFLHIPPKRADFYDSPRAGWDEVIGRFGDCASDVEEMRKCFALARYPASVFHSVQVIEVGLIALGNTIGVTDPLSGWTAVTSQLLRIIKTEHSKRTAFQQRHAAFLEQVHACVEALKNAWRNKISHAQVRLVLVRTDFAEETAEEIISASRSLMRRLALEMPSDPTGM